MKLKFSIVEEKKNPIDLKDSIARLFIALIFVIILVILSIVMGAAAIVGALIITAIISLLYGSRYDFLTYYIDKSTVVFSDESIEVFEKEMIPITHIGSLSFLIGYYKNFRKTAFDDTYNGISYVEIKSSGEVYSFKFLIESERDFDKFVKVVNSYKDKIKNIELLDFKTRDRVSIGKLLGN